MIVRRAAMSRRDAVSRLLLLTLFLFSFVGGTRADEKVPRRTTQTFTKEITGYGNGEGGYYLIATPVTVEPIEGNDFLANEFDLYRFNQSAEKEWENWKAEEEGNRFSLEPGRGYLYANSENVTLTFTGTPYKGDGEVTLAKINGAQFEGWNLVGNPFNVSAMVDRAFYVMNDEGSGIIAADGEYVIKPMEGIFVVATEDGETVTFMPGEGNARGASFALNLSRGSVSTSSKTIDRVIVRFGEGRMLPKFQLNPNHTKVYIPMDGKDYAVVRSKGMGEMPVNFKADANGSYTLSLSAEEIGFEYLHLIDSKTGNDIDLLETPSYTFEASTADDDSRFKIVFAQDGDTKTNTPAGVKHSPTRGGEVPVLPNHGEDGNQSASGESVDPEEPEPEDASLTVNPDMVVLDVNEHSGTLGLTYENLTVNSKDDLHIQYCDADGSGIDQPDWIEVTIANKQGGGYEVSYHLNENEGNETRTAYFEVYAFDNEYNYVSSNLVTVTQGPIPYVAANGSTAYCRNYTILGGSTSTSTTTLPGGWYVVTGSNVSYSAGLTFYDDTNDTHIILADGAKLSRRWLWHLRRKW